MSGLADPRRDRRQFSPEDRLKLEAHHVPSISENTNYITFSWRNTANFLFFRGNLHHGAPIRVGGIAEDYNRRYAVILPRRYSGRLVGMMGMAVV